VAAHGFRGRGLGGDVVLKSRIDACISSRSIKFKYFGGSRSNGDINMDIYFMDFIFWSSLFF
jgi:hypothetical protein